MVANVIILNGAGCAGKSSIARALQSITTEPFLHVQMDSFLEMLPEIYHAHPDGFTYETALDNGKPMAAIRTGPVGERTLRGMRYAVAAMAAQGNNLIVDDVMLEDAGRQYADLLSAFETFFVGVFAPLDVLEARERQRADRMIGLARWQYDRVHEGMKYDLEINTSKATPPACADLIKKKFQL